MLPNGFQRTHYSLLIGSVCYNGIHFWKRETADRPSEHCGFSCIWWKSLKASVLFDIRLKRCMTAGKRANSIWGQPHDLEHNFPFTLSLLYIVHRFKLILFARNRNTKPELNNYYVERNYANLNRTLSDPNTRETILQLRRGIRMLETKKCKINTSNGAQNLKR